MHSKFYHWHSRTELRSDPSVLELRWNAAAEFGSSVDSNALCSLLRLALGRNSDLEFCEEFTESMLGADPTFPPEENIELLRVMAEASLFSILETTTSDADAAALGLTADLLPRVRPAKLNSDLLDKANIYLHEESERLRPEISSKTSKKLEAASLKTKAILSSAPTSDVPQLAKATQELGDLLISSIKTNRDLSVRLAEESQFLWWLTNAQSPKWDCKRSELTASAYSLAAAAEAAERVKIIPHPRSVESILEACLNQCKQTPLSATVLQHIQNINSINIDTILTSQPIIGLTPVMTFLSSIKQGHPPDKKSLTNLDLSDNTKITPTAIATQYLREIIFTRALKLV